MSRWYKKSIDEALSTLKVDKDKGLSTVEAAERLQKYGLNMIEEVDGKKWYHLVLEQFTNVMVIILVVAMIVSFAVGEYIDAAAIGVIILINAIVGFVQEFKAEKAIEALRSLTAPNAIVLRDGEVQSVDATELVPGDIVILEEGKFVPADARLLEEAELQTNESSLTGESNPVEKILDKISKDSGLADRKNIVYMGTTVTKGHGKAVVVHTGMQTEFGAIAHMVQTEESGQTPLQKQLAKLSKYLAYITLGIIAVLFVTTLFTDRDPLEMFILSISLAVSVIPEGLPAVITLTLAISVQKMAKENAIIRKLPAAETLGSTSVICTDKTGTLTQNQMTVQRVYVNGKQIKVSGVGYKPKGEFTVDGKKFDPKKDKEFMLLAQCGLLCNNSKLIEKGKFEVIGDPTEGCLITLAAKAGMLKKEEDKKHKRIQELVFDSERKRMSTLNKVGSKKILFTKGAPDSVLEICDRILENGKVRKLSKADKKRIMAENDAYAQQAFRVLSFAYTDKGHKEEKMIFLGLTGIIDPPRPEVKKAIAVCKSAHIDVVMITGDHALTAKAIGEEIGLFKEGDRILTGAELEHMKDAELRHIVEDVKIYARVNPVHKVKILKALQEKDHIVAMTGDGVNDAPALKSADIGVAMGITGTDVSKEASQMILTDDNFATIVSAVKSGRVIYSNIKEFIRFLLSANFDEILVITIVFLAGFPIPFLPLQILWVNLLTDALPAIALGIDKGDDDIMELKPRNPKANIFKELISFSLLAGIISAAISIVIYFTVLPQGTIEHTRTMMFTIIVIFELMLVFSVRNGFRNLFHDFFSNKLLIFGVIFSLIMQLLVIYLPPLQKVFETVPLTVNDWLMIVIPCMGGIAIIELWKSFRVRPDHL